MRRDTKLIKMSDEAFAALWHTPTLTCAAIAKIGDCSLRTVKTRARSQLLPTRRNGRPRNAPEGQESLTDEAFTALWEADIPVKDIASLIGTMPPAVSKRAAKLKLKGRQARGFKAEAQP